MAIKGTTGCSPGRAANEDPMVTTKGLTTMRARERRKVRVPQAVFVFAGIPRISCRREISPAAVPGVMATHFGASGAANGWQTKGQFFVVELVMLGVCLLIGFGVPCDYRRRAAFAGEFAEQRFLARSRPPRSHAVGISHPDGLVRLRPPHISDRSQSASLQRQSNRPAPLNGPQFTWHW